MLLLRRGDNADGAALAVCGRPRLRRQTPACCDDLARRGRGGHAATAARRKALWQRGRRQERRCLLPLLQLPLALGAKHLQGAEDGLQPSAAGATLLCPRLLQVGRRWGCPLLLACRFLRRTLHLLLLPWLNLRNARCRRLCALLLGADGCFSAARAGRRGGLQRCRLGGGSGASRRRRGRRQRRSHWSEVQEGLPRRGQGLLQHGGTGQEGSDVED